ncbi:uncharacterized protein LOC109724064 isoform X2 [Ananas comosus]|uniref:Uncharacterized protein LOC109724064 isoform X2 n=1 Tax=Ananas comosus TaxID=4615 RepID=A0A6P5GK03_ANACO|nr:uncharacterized protein LOC109724064 isoform X2 [Ananas comosus]
MSFKLVFNSLQEIFPEVDLRILKAVAIEHANDIDAAAEFILLEVIPNISASPEASSFNMNYAYELKDSSFKRPNPEEFERGSPSRPTKDSQLKSPYLEEGVFGDRVVGPACDVDGSGSLTSSDESNEELNAPVPSTSKLENRSDPPSLGVFRLEQQYPGAQNGNPFVHVISRPVHEDSLGEHIVEPCSEFKASGNDSLCTSSQQLSGLDPEQTVAAVESSSRDGLLIVLPDLADHKAAGMKDVNNSFSESEAVSRWSDDVLETNDARSGFTSCRDIVPLLNEENNSYMGREDEEPNITDNNFSGDKGLQSSYSEDLASLEYEMLHAGDRNLPGTLATRSGHFVDVELLEEFITDAKSNKKNLLSAAESVTNVIKEVELLEERAKQAKKEASNAGKGISEKANELKQTLKHAKEANEMRAAEIYGEKSILATEARELLSRLASLSDERNKSLTIIEEVRQTLEGRLAVASEEIASAEKEKLEKEALACEALQEQEVLMNALVEESKKLQQEAEENTKLRDFLMERGRLVDSLQGEIAVMCEDVLLLKERVDGRVPLSKSLQLMASSLSSSSSSSFRNSRCSSDGVVLPAISADKQVRIDEERSVSQKLNISEEIEPAKTDGSIRRSTSEDGWELCEEGWLNGKP